MVDGADPGIADCKARMVVMEAEERVSFHLKGVGILQRFLNMMRLGGGDQRGTGRVVNSMSRAKDAHRPQLLCPDGNSGLITTLRSFKCIISMRRIKKVG